MHGVCIDFVLFVKIRLDNRPCVLRFWHLYYFIHELESSSHTHQTNDFSYYINGDCYDQSTLVSDFSNIRRSSVPKRIMSPVGKTIARHTAYAMVKWPANIVIQHYSLIDHGFSSEKSITWENFCMLIGYIDGLVQNCSISLANALDSSGLFTYILQGCCIGSETIITFAMRWWSNPKGYGLNGPYIQKSDREWTVCMHRSIYCTYTSHYIQ